jgi:hypothetical protein
MATQKKISINKGVEVKSIEYPVIYSYIYERESQDIKRLAEKFKNTRVKKVKETPVERTIVGFTQNENGVIIPIYAKAKTEKKSELKKQPVSKKSTTSSNVKKVQITQKSLQKSANDKK